MNAKQPIRDLVTIDNRIAEVEVQFEEWRAKSEKARTKWEESGKKHDGWKQEMSACHTPLYSSTCELEKLRERRAEILIAINPVLQQLDAALDLADAVRRLQSK